MGDCARRTDSDSEGGWAGDHGDVGAWCSDGQGGGAWADSGRGGHEGCGDSQAGGGDWNTGSVDHGLGCFARATFADGDSLRLGKR